MGGSSKSHHHHHLPSPPPPPSPQHCLNKKKVVTRSIYALLPLAILHFYFFPRPISTITTVTAINSSAGRSGIGRGELRRAPPRTPPCDYSVGRWIPATRGDGGGGPIYNGTSCATIKPGQNCMLHGRPDTGYLHWRWKPRRCRLPPFSAAALLRRLRHRHLAFVGDSMARNQLESLLCLLSTDSDPDLVFRDGDDNKFRRWYFRNYNATVSIYWSPFLVKGKEKTPAKGLDHNELFLDEVDDRWASDLGTIDLVVLSAGHWFLHPAVYYEKGGDEILGCHYCPGLNHTEIGFYGVFRKAFRTAIAAVAAATGEKYAVVTTFSPSHFEGEWDKAGACPRTEPYKEGEKKVEGMDAEMRMVQIEEVAAAAEKKKVTVEALDVTAMAMMRPDGHPGPYMYGDPFAGGKKPERVQNDCVHWCLPGPIDAWNEIFSEMVRRWADTIAGTGGRSD